jgi:hypothetical protein
MLKYSAVRQYGDNGSSASSASEESTDSRRVSFSHQAEPHGADMSPSLELHYERNLGAMAPSKIKSTFEKNLPMVLQDPGLPRFIKALLVEKMSAMARILGDMALQSPSELLMRSDREGSHFDQYAEVSTRLKAALIMHKDPAGVTFSGRSLKLFSWCQAELKETRHPLVNVLLARLSEETRKEAEVKFDRLADISNLLVLQITCGDDIADNIQDEELVPIFVSIPLSDKAREAQGSMCRAAALAFVIEHRGGIFAPYYETAVTIWDDATSQLRGLFGAHWDTIEPDFLQLHEKAMHSLTYSILMNIDPLDPAINLGSILDNLAPNMMIECFRFLEKALTLQIAASESISLPESDFAICDGIVVQSQKSASLANSTATASREMRESDISNPIPFELNGAYMDSLGDRPFAPIFEAFLKANGYDNHFFSHYYASGKPPEDFNCLSLLMLRKMAISQIVVNLNTLTFAPSPEDYALDHLADKALERISKSHNRQNALIGETLSKFKQHVLLIDSFFESILKETNVETHLFEIWKQGIDEMRTKAVSIQEPTLKKHAETYVTSWEDFLCMYLLFKRAYDGTI